jgi:hypothetical protein
MDEIQENIYKILEEALEKRDNKITAGFKNLLAKRQTNFNNLLAQIAQDNKDKMLAELEYALKLNKLIIELCDALHPYTKAYDHQRTDANEAIIVICEEIAELKGRH